MKRVLALGAAFALLTAGAFLGAPHGTAGADDAEVAQLLDVGWWSTTPGTAEPEGGFQVSQDPQGVATAVAAIKLKVTVKSLAPALFVFNEGTTKLSEASADIKLCKGLSNDWAGENANPGGFDSAPKFDCTKSVQLKRDDTLKAWSGDAGPLISGPATVTIMVVPNITPHNASFPFPTYESLPHVNTPVPTPVGIPPPLPVDYTSPDPLGPVFSTIDCPPGYYDVTNGLGMPMQCFGLPRVVPPTPLPGLPTPATVDLPFSVGFQVEMISTQLSAAALDESGGFSDGDLSAAGGGVSDSGVFDTSQRNSVLSDSLGAAGSPPLTEAGAAALGEGSTGTPALGGALASSSKGRPWGRIWLLGVVALAVGAGSVWARRATAQLGM
jgi:hypothetical protein